MRCRFCPRGVPGQLQRPTGFMDLGLFRALLAQLHPEQARYRPLELHHLGESLLHPQVTDFVAAATARGLPTEMSVNPSLLTPELGRRLLDSGLRRLVVSLDGLDDPTLVRIRGPAARYTRAEPNLQALLDEVAARGDAAPQIVIQMIDLHANRDQHEAFLARWGTTGLKTVTAYIKALDGPDPDAADAAATHETGQAGREPLRYLCSYPFRSVVVLWDGRVVPCCRDDDGRLLGVRLAGETLAQSWLKRAMAEDELDASLIRLALAPSAKPPVTMAPRNIVCKCADVSDVQIQKELTAGADFAGLQEKLKCGTFCGSCVPDIKRMVAESATQQAAAA